MSASNGHYEELAAVAFRVIGVCAFILGLLSRVYSLIHTLPDGLASIVAAMLPGLLYLAFGLLLFVLSKRLARLVAGGFEE